MDLRLGLDSADSDAVVLMAADLQDLPAGNSFWSLCGNGKTAIRMSTVSSRPGRPADVCGVLNSAYFIWLIARMSEDPLPPHARDFRLLDREVYEEIRTIRDPHPFHRGLAAGRIPSIGLKFEQPPRFAGETKASTRKVSVFAVRSLFTQSMTPLRVMPFLGVILIAIALVALVTLTVNALVNGVPFSGIWNDSRRHDHDVRVVIPLP